MKATLVLLRFALRRDRTTLVPLAILLFLFELALVWAARVMDTTGGFGVVAQIIPDFVRTVPGFDVTLLLSFSGALGLGYFHPVALAVLVAGAIVAARGPVGEIAGRTSELLIARPLRRTALVTASLLELSLVAVVFPSAMLAGTLAGLAMLGKLGAVPLGLYLRLALNAASLAAGLGAVFVLLSAVSSRTRAYTQATIALSLVSALIDFLARVWAPVRPLSLLSLFHYFEPVRLLTGQSVLANLSLLAGVALIAAAGALLVFHRRDM